MDNLVVFGLSHDLRSVRAGVWDFVTRRVRWFSPGSDEGRIREVSAWVSNDEFVYPIKIRTPEFVRVNGVTDQARPCAECSTRRP